MKVQCKSLCLLQAETARLTHLLLMRLRCPMTGWLLAAVRALLS